MSQCFARTRRSTLATRAAIGVLPRSGRVSGLPLIHGIAQRRGTDEAGPEPTTRQLGLGIAKVPINGLFMGDPGFGCGVTGYHGQEVPGQAGVKSSKSRVKCRQRLQPRKRDPRQCSGRPSRRHSARWPCGSLIPSLATFLRQNRHQLRLWRQGKHHAHQAPRRTHLLKRPGLLTASSLENMESCHCRAANEEAYAQQPSGARASVTVALRAPRRSRRDPPPLDQIEIHLPDAPPAPRCDPAPRSGR